MLAPREDGMGSGLHTALIQDPAMTQGKADNGVYDHGHTAFQRKGEAAPYGHAAPGWPHRSPAADPLFPEPETAVPKPFNGGAARWGANDGEAKRNWGTGGRPNPRAEGAELRRAPIGQAPAANGARRWDDTRPQERATNNWNGESRPAAREDSTWRGAGAGMGTARFAQPKNDIHWRKGDPPGPAARPNDTRREAPAAQGAAAPSFAAAHGLVPGARAPTGMRPAPAFGTRAPQGLKKYRKEDLLGVLTTMKQQVGDHLPVPEGSNLEEGVKELWRADAVWNAAQWHGTAQAAPSAPPGLDPYMQKLHSVLPQLSGLGIPAPLQALKMGTYFYKDPQGLVHGPFTAESLISWNTQGYLYPELECATSQDAQTFFPFSALSELWALQDKLGLKPEDVQKLADAEVRLAKQPAPPPAPAAPVYDNVNMHQQVPTEQPTPYMGAQAIHNAAAMDPAAVADHHVAATDGGWDAPPVDQRRGQMQQQPQAPRPNPIAAAKQQSALYDPIDDIIDDGLPQPVAAAPGERTLQPFTGMGMGGAPAASQAVAPAPKYIPPEAGHMRTQQARAVPDAMENLHISDAPARRADAPARRVEARAPTGTVEIHDLFEGQAIGQGAVASKGNHAAEPVTAQRIVPSQLFAQFNGAPGAATNGHSQAMAMQGLPVQPPPPRAAAAPQASAAPRWGGAQPVRPAKFDEIQAEEMRKRRQEDAAAQVAAKNQMAQAEAERARRAAWAAQPKPVNFRQIVEDDEECAADLEGGCFEGEEEELDVQPMGYNPWQGQAALPADGRAHPGAHLGVDIFRQGVTADDGAAQHAAAVPAVPPPPARAARTAAQVLGQDSRAANVQHAPRRAAAGNAAKQPAWQANAGRAAEHVAPPPPPAAANMLQEPEPEILKNNPEFYEWCMLEMGRLQGDINILVVLLETGANCEIMDFARSNLKGDNIGAFVSEFIKRKAQAAAAKPAGRKRRGNKTAAAAAGTAVAPQAAPARAGPVAAEMAGDGWEAVGTKGKQRRNVKPGAAAQNGGQNMRPGGGAFAVLPSS